MYAEYAEYAGNTGNAGNAGNAGSSRCAGKDGSRCAEREASAGAEADHEIDISAGTFDMEGVVWGAKEAREGKKDKEE